MTEKKAEIKLGLFNIFNVGGAIYGWFHGHTWNDVVVGYLVGWCLPFVVVFGFLIIALAVVKSGEFISNSLPTRVRVAEDLGLRDGESQEARWIREYAEHCKAQGIANELAPAPIHHEPDYTTTTSTSDTGTSYWGGTTSGFGPG